VAKAASDCDLSVADEATMKTLELRELVNIRPLLVAAILGAVLGACSCDSGIKEITYDPAKVAKALNDCATRSNAARAALLKIKDAVSSGLGPKNKVILDPLPVYVEEGTSYDPSVQKNTALLTEEALADPEATPQGFDLRMQDRLWYALMDTRPGNTNPGDPDRIRADCDEGFSFRYLIVIRTGSVQLPVESKDPGQYDKFTPGTANIDAFLIDMTTQKILARVEVTGESSDNIQYKLDHYRAGAEALKSDLIINTRKAIAEALTKATGGTFVVSPYL
jgi:hypothetical protein